jgi:hypothetical protein
MPSTKIMIESIQHIIAVVGCQRSGTTLTGQILGAHPDAVLIDEPDGLYPWFHAVAEGRATAHDLAGKMLRRAAEKYSAPAGRFVENGNKYTLDPGIRVLIFKAPNLSYDWRKISSFPVPISIVYPVRDPRAVVASMARLRHIDFIGNQRRLIEERPAVCAEFQAELQMLGDDSLPIWLRHTIIWKVKSGLADRFRQQGLPVRQFRYEDLVRAPQTIIDNLSDYCFGGAVLLRDPDDVYIGLGPGGTDRTRPVDQSSLRAWKTTITQEKEAEILRTAGPLAEDFNYV